MKKIYSILFVAASSISFAQTTITQWTFDDAVPATAMLATTGSGTFTTIGGVVDNLNTGLMPAGNPGKAYSVKGFPASLTASETAGFEFDLSTVNYTGVTVDFDLRGSGTASKWAEYQYSIDGTTWITLSNNGGTLLNDFTLHTSLSLPVTVNNDANFKFRIVSIFDPSGTDYMPVTTTNTYSPGGAWRVDNATFKGVTLGVESNKIEALKVYPNPVSDGKLFISSSSNSDKTIVVFDVLGKQVLSGVVNNEMVNVSSLKSGVYMIKISEEGKSETRKLIIR